MYQNIDGGLIGSALLASVAFAQQSPTQLVTGRHGAGGGIGLVVQGNWRASKLVGLSVYNDNNESLGLDQRSLDGTRMKHQGSVLGVRRLPRRRRAAGRDSLDKMKFVNEACRLHRRAAGQMRMRQAPAGAIDDHRRGDHEHCTATATTTKSILGIPITPWSARPRTAEGNA